MSINALIINMLGYIFHQMHYFMFYTIGGVPEKCVFCVHSYRGQNFRHLFYCASAH